MTPSESIEKFLLPSNTLPKSQSVSPIQNVVFSLHDGKLLVTPKHSQLIQNFPSSSVCAVSGDITGIKEREEEIHIEIFRENSAQVNFSHGEEETITNISSAYEAFWKSNFQQCLDRRTCLKCQQIFLTPQQLVHHFQYSHQILNPVECFICYNIFTDDEERTKHLSLIHHVAKPNCTCEICFKVFSSETEKNVHSLLHTASKKCRWCSECFPSKYLLNCHLQYCLLRNNNQECHICGCHFKSSHIRQLHSLRHTRISCAVCDFSLMGEAGINVEYTEIALIRHLKSAHTTEEVNNCLQALKKQDDEEETLDLLFMNQIQSNLAALQETHPCSTKHIEQIAQSVSLNVLPEETRLEKDQIPKTPTLNLQCQECLITFTKKEELIKHQVVHQLPFSCSLCNIKFPHRRKFKTHMRSHGIKVKPHSVWYKCMECCIQCPTLSSLRIHLLTHTDQKPQLCDQCGVRFRRPQALKVHQQSVHNVRTPSSCPYCGISSLSKKSLLRHIQCVHGGVRRFICGLCGTRCLQNQDLRRHLKSLHKLDLPPMKMFLKKSSTGIHVIPSIDGLSPMDPLAIVVKQAVNEEESKVLLFRQRKMENNFNKGTDQITISNENSIEEGQSLNILGDVAAKAVPLEQTVCSTASLQETSNSKLSEYPQFLGAGCHLSTDSFHNFSSHLAQGHKKRASPLPGKQKDLEESCLSKVQVPYPVTSTLLSSATTTPYQFHIISTQSVRSDLQAPHPNEQSRSASPALSSLNVGPIFYQAVHTAESLNNCAYMHSTGGVEVETVNGSANTVSLKQPIIDLNESCNLPPAVLSSGTTEFSSISHLELMDHPLQDDVLKKLETSATYCAVNSSVDNHYQLFGRCEIQDDTKQEEPDCNNYERRRTAGTVHKAPQVKNQVVEDKDDKDGYFSNVTNILHDVNQDLLLITTAHNNRSIEVLPSVLEQSKTTDKMVPSEYHNTLSFNLRDHVLLHNSVHKADNSPSVQNKDLTEPDLRQPNLSNALSDPEFSLNTSLSIDRSDLPSLAHVKDGAKTCPECGKKLSCSSNFYRHMQIHSGHKPHECLHCGKSFRYKHNLTVHVRCHTGERPYECTVCNKKFRYLTELKEHKLSHDGTKQFMCSTCGQGFKHQRDLRRHSLSHSSHGKPTCPICKKSFSRVDYLKIHLKSHKRLDGEEKVTEEVSEDRTSCPQNSNVFEKLVQENKSLIVCQLGSSEFSNNEEWKVPKENCRNYRPQEAVSKIAVEQNLNDPSLKSPNVTGDTSRDVGVLPGNSEDLISLAYQAAEDGVEFVCVEEVNKAVISNEVKMDSQNTESNIIYVQILEPDEIKL